MRRLCSTSCAIKFEGKPPNSNWDQSWVLTPQQQEKPRLFHPMGTSQVWIWFHPLPQAQSSVPTLGAGGTCSLQQRPKPTCARHYIYTGYVYSVVPDTICTWATNILLSLLSSAKNGNVTGDIWSMGPGYPGDLSVSLLPFHTRFLIQIIWGLLLEWWEKFSLLCSSPQVYLLLCGHFFCFLWKIPLHILPPLTSFFSKHQEWKPPDSTKAFRYAFFSSFDMQCQVYT